MKKKNVGETREQFNALRRESYRKKKEEDMVRLQEYNQPSLSKTGKYLSVILLTTLGFF